MTLDECRAAFAAAETVPVEALRAAVPLAGGLVAEVTTLLELAARDEPLLLEEERLTTYGLAVLAAARRTEIFPAFATMLTQSETLWTRLLGNETETFLPPLVTALYDGGDTDAIYDLMGDEATLPDLKSALFLAFGWLVMAGRADRIRLTDSLNWFGSTADLDDPAWFGWLAAARALGLDDQVKLNHQRLLDDLSDGGTEEDAAWRAVIGRALAPGALDAAAPVEDPALAFGSSSLVPPAPAGMSALSPAERSWLDWLLLALSVRGAALPLEAVDGYFTALHIAPAELPFAACEAPIWTGATARERFTRPEIADAARGLLARCFDAGRARLASGAPAQPLLEVDDPLLAGALWATGFVTGMDRTPRTWNRLLLQPEVRSLVDPLLSLEETGVDEDPWGDGSDPGLPEPGGFDPDAGDADDVADEDPDAFDDELDELDELEEERIRLRGEILDALPETIQTLRRVVRATVLPPERPAGRNDPCPCGSGKKYKKCCGAPGAVPKF